VESKRETGYEWLRFSRSLELDGEDYRDASITLYRIEVDIDPLTAGEELAGKKVEGQAVTRRADVGRNLGGVLWQGFEADYRAESGAVRHEEYLFTGFEGGPLYVFWARGPAASWEADAQLRQRSLEKVAAKLGAERSDPEEVEEKR
jgi:hypothetical protein